MQEHYIKTYAESTVVLQLGDPHGSKHLVLRDMRSQIELTGVYNDKPELFTVQLTLNQAAELAKFLKVMAGED